MQTTKKSIFRVGVIGCGNIFRSHSPVYIDDPNVVLVGFYDRIQNRAEAWYNHFNQQMNLLKKAIKHSKDPLDSLHQKRCDIFKTESKIYSSIEKLIDNVDVLDICSPTYSHVPYALWALKKGKSVMVEKPPARCSYETDQLMNFKPENSTRFQINENFIWQNYIYHLHQLVHSKQLGEIKKIKIRLGHGGPAWGWNNHFLNPSLSGGGILQDMGSHALGAVFGILGKNLSILKIQSINMKTGTEKERTLQRTDGINEYYVQRFMVEDEAHIKFWVQNTLSSSPIEIELETSWSKTYKDLIIEGTLGSCQLDHDELNRKVLKMNLAKQKTKIIELSPQARDSHQIQILKFIKALTSDEPIHADEKFAHLIQTIISGAYYSNLLAYESSIKQGMEITPEDLKQFYQEFKQSSIPKEILVDEIIYRFMSPFTNTYYIPGDNFTQTLNLQFD